MDQKDTQKKQRNKNFSYIDLEQPNKIIRDQSTAAHILAECRGETAIEHMLNLIKSGANLNAVNSSNSTPLMIACRRGNLRMAEAIASNGGESSEILGYRPTHSALQLLLIRVDELSLDEIEAIKLIIIMIKYNRVSISKKYNPFCVLSEVEISRSIVDTLIAHGCKITIVNRFIFHMSPLIHAVSNNYLKLIGPLSEKNMLNFKDLSGYTAVDYACFNVNYKAVHMLCVRGANIDAINNKCLKLLDQVICGSDIIPLIEIMRLQLCINIDLFSEYYTDVLNMRVSNFY